MGVVGIDGKVEDVGIDSQFFAVAVSQKSEWMTPAKRTSGPHLGQSRLCREKRLVDEKQIHLQLRA
jgi:hypothetical protein